MKKGKENIVKYEDVLKKVEDDYGVKGKVIEDLWGIEKEYGEIKGDLEKINEIVKI